MINKQEFLKRIERLININKCKDKDYQRNLIPIELRKQIWQEQNYKCYLCSTDTMSPLTHHIQPDGESINENLILLCPTCHEFIHVIIHRLFGFRRYKRIIGKHW